MNRLWIIAIAAFSLVAGGCNDDEGVKTATNANTITISTSIGNLSRVTTTGNASVFDSGDEISVYAWTGDKETIPENGDFVVDNAINTLGEDQVTWIAEPQMLWKDMLTEHYFLGVFPKKDITTFVGDEYVLNVDDQTGSDLLVAVNTTGYNGNQGVAVPLQFSHLLAKFVVNLSFRNQWGGEPTVESVVCRATGKYTVDYLKKSVTAVADGISAIVLPVVTENTLYSSVFVPQSGFDTVLVKIGEKTFTYTHPSEIPIESGKITTLNLTVGRNVIEIGSISINDWIPGTLIPDGEAFD